MVSALGHCSLRIRSDDGLTLETSTRESLFGDQFIVKKKTFVSIRYRLSTTVSLENNPYIMPLCASIVYYLLEETFKVFLEILALVVVEGCTY